MIRLVVSETDGRRHDSEMGTTGERKQSLRPISWAECRGKKIGIEPKGSTFLFTFPLIGLFRFPVPDKLGTEPNTGISRVINHDRSS
jgi:hypothetical protein